MQMVLDNRCANTDLQRGHDPKIKNRCFKPFFMGYTCNSVVEPLRNVCQTLGSMLSKKKSF